MKFYIPEAKDLWTCVDKVMTAAPRRTMGGENNAVALQTIDNRLYVHRYTESGYAEMVVPEVEILEPGHIVIGDGKLFQFYQGERVFEMDGAYLVSGADKLKLTSGDPFLYARQSPPPDGIVITADLSGVLWTVEKESDLFDWVMLDGCDVATSNNYNICVANAGIKLTEDKPVFVPREFFALLKKEMVLTIEGSRVWLRSGEFACYLNTVEKNIPSGYFRNGINGKLELGNAKIVVDKSDLLAALRYTYYITADNVNRNGKCKLILSGNQLQVETVGGQVGAGQRTLVSDQATGQFEMYQYPGMIASAAEAADDEKVTLEGWYSAHFNAYALLVHGANIISFIPSPSVGEVTKKE